MVGQVDWMSSLKSRNSIAGTPTTVGRNSETATGKIKKRRGRDDRNPHFDGAGPKKSAFSGHRVRFTFGPESMPEANFQPYTHRFAAAWECGLLGPPTGLISHKCVPSVQSDGEDSRLASAQAPRTISLSPSPSFAWIALFLPNAYDEMAQAPATAIPRAQGHLRRFHEALA
jgi:hypothetical protein